MSIMVKVLENAKREKVQPTTGWPLNHLKANPTPWKEVCTIGSPNHNHGGPCEI